jgi:hypothetical protein
MVGVFRMKENEETQYILSLKYWNVSENFDKIP